MQLKGERWVRETLFYSLTSTSQQVVNSHTLNNPKKLKHHAFYRSDKKKNLKKKKSQEVSE